MPSCQHADARWLSSHPRLRADGRTVATHRTTPSTVLPSAPPIAGGTGRAYSAPRGVIVRCNMARSAERVG